MSLRKPDLLVHRFVVIAPTLDSYRYELLLVRHTLNVYPLHIYADKAVMEEVAPENNYLVAETESIFIDLLKRIFAASKTQHLIRTLIDHSKVRSLSIG